LTGLKCPHCGFEGEFKQLKMWKYSWWNVYLYQCPKCGRQFRYQVDPEGKRKSYVLRIGVGGKRKGGQYATRGSNV
jgi:DNA-directed RNA polymerase subunit RPC12/RpoP